MSMVKSTIQIKHCCYLLYFIKVLSDKVIKTNYFYTGTQHLFFFSWIVCSRKLFILCITLHTGILLAYLSYDKLKPRRTSLEQQRKLTLGYKPCGWAVWRHWLDHTYVQTHITGPPGQPWTTRQAFALARPWETSQLHLEPQRQKRDPNSGSQLLNHAFCLIFLLRLKASEEI